MTPTTRHVAVPIAAFSTTAAMLIAGVVIATAEPASVADQRAKVAQLQSELNAIGADVETAAEAYNGARYRLGLIEEDIRTTRAELKTSKKNLATSQGRLADRMRALYVQPDPSVAEILLTSSSISEVSTRIELVEQIASSDAQIVSAVKAQRVRLTARRAELATNRAAAEKEVASAEAERARVEVLLARRRTVLSSAEAGLRQAVAAEQARQRRIAESQRAAARRSPVATPAPSPTQEAPSPAAEPAPTLPDASGNARAAQIALQYLGVPYVWGGASPSGFDCSGLISYAYAQIGKSVPHYTGAIWSAFPKVPSGSLQPGDAVFFRSDLGHAGVYIGSGRYVHAPQTGDVVKISAISDRSDYQGAVRP